MTYAEAFMRGLNAEQYNEALEDLSTFASLYAEEPRIKLLLGNPAIPADEKSGLICAIAERGGFLDESRNFLLLLLRNDRVFMLGQVVESFEQLLRDVAWSLRAVRAHLFRVPRCVVASPLKRLALFCCSAHLRRADEMFLGLVRRWGAW